MLEFATWSARAMLARTRAASAGLTVVERLRPSVYASASVPSFESGPTRAHEAGMAHAQAASRDDWKLGSKVASAAVAAAAEHEAHGW